MLKSLSTQFVATLCFGPLGLLYSSVAAAVFFTLLLAVLYFTELGILALLLVWPVTILTGLVFVKLHNDQVRSSGGRLLLTPEDDGYMVSAGSSWVRGLAVLSLIGIVGYLVLWHFNKDNAHIGRIVEAAQLESTDKPVVVESEDLLIPVVTTTAEPADKPVTVISSEPTAEPVTEQLEIATVVVGTSADAELAATLLYVDAPVVNIRKGPGTNTSVLVQLSSGTELNEIGRSGDWINVIHGASGTTGWIFDRLVSTQR